jgi:hypothetical protein
MVNYSLCVLIAIPLGAAVLDVCGTEYDARTDAIQANANLTVSSGATAQEQLAVIQTKSPTVSRALVAQFDMVLSSLEKKCDQTRNSSPSLGDVAMKAVQLFRDNRNPMTPLEVLQAMDKSIPESTGTKLNCVETTAMLLTMMGVTAR